jgi:hypothetical protein
MSLTNVEIESLAKKMNIPLEFIGFKDELLFMKPKPNKAYIINMENEFNEDGRPNSGSHWVILLTTQTKSNQLQFMYMDSYGVPAPIEIQKFVNMKQVPYNTKDIQGLLSAICGYFCLALAHFVFSSEHHTGDFYSDCNNFIDLFQNMNETIDMYVNEGILRAFFQSSDPKERIPVKNLREITELTQEQAQSLGLLTK